MTKHREPSTTARLWIHFSSILIVIFSTCVLAGPPTPDEFNDEYELGEFEEEALIFSENYLDLISELEVLLEEFEVFFEEFGVATLDEMAAELEDFRISLYDEYSEEAHEELMEEMDEVLDELKEIKEDLDETDSRSKRKYLRRLRSFEQDLEDIREELKEQLSDERFRKILDSEKLRKAVEIALLKAREKLRKQEVKDYRQEAREAMLASPEEPFIDVSPPTPPPTVIALPEIDFSEWYYESSAYMKAEVDAYITLNTTVPVENNQIRIELNNGIGSVNVTTWNRSQVEAVLTVGYNESSPKSRDMAKAIGLLANGDEKRITIDISYPRENEKTANIVASQLEVTLPRTNPVTIRNSFGPVSIADLQNTLTIESNFASIDVQSLKGDALIRNSTGPIYLENLNGQVNVHNQFGPIEAVRLQGKSFLSSSYATIQVKNSTGNMVINNSGAVALHHHIGDARIDASNGEIEIFKVDGDLNVSNSFGAVRLESITGDVYAQNANAVIEIKGVGGRLKASNSFAPIYIDGVEKNADIASSNAEISLENVRGDVLIDNSFGNVSLEMVDGYIRVKNSNAAVSVSSAKKGTSITNQFGPVYLTSVDGNVIINNKNASVDLADIRGSATIRTSFGLVSGENLKGPLIINNENGSIDLAELYLQREDSCQFSTTFGDIRLALLKPLNYNISAQTTFGEIQSDMPLVYTTSGNVNVAEYTGAVIGPTILINGQNSSISILTRD